MLKKQPVYRPRGFYLNLAVVSAIGVGITYYVWMPQIAKTQRVSQRPARSSPAAPSVQPSPSDQ